MLSIAPPEYLNGLTTFPIITAVFIGLVAAKSPSGLCGFTGWKVRGSEVVPSRIAARTVTVDDSDGLVVAERVSPGNIISISWRFKARWKVLKANSLSVDASVQRNVDIESGMCIDNTLHLHDVAHADAVLSVPTHALSAPTGTRCINAGRNAEKKFRPLVCHEWPSRGL